MSCRVDEVTRKLLCITCRQFRKSLRGMNRLTDTSSSIINNQRHLRAILRQLCCHLLLFQRCYPCLFRLFKRLLMLDLLNFSFDDMFP